MVGRLANVVYWTASGIAAIVLVGGFAAANSEPRDTTSIMIATVVIAGLVWIAGKAVRYVLSGN